MNKVSLYKNIILIIVITMAKMNKKKETADKNKEYDVKIDLKEAKKAIDEFINKKNNKFSFFIKKKREIHAKRRKEEEKIINGYYDMLEQKGKEDNILKGEYLYSKYEERIELDKLKQKLNLNDDECLLLQKDETIPINNELEEKEKESNNKKEKYLHINFK